MDNASLAAPSLSRRIPTARSAAANFIISVTVPLSWGLVREPR